MSLALLYRFIRYKKSPGHPWPPKPTHLTPLILTKAAWALANIFFPIDHFFPVKHHSSQDGFLA